MPKRDRTRREILKDAAAWGVGVGVGVAALSSARVVSEEGRYDYIVVGSGAGGGPLAARLALAGYRVLVIEAGNDVKNLNYQVPAFHPLSTEDPQYSWNFYVNHFPRARAGDYPDSKFVPGKGVLYPRAATVGGCTAHNAMVAMYPDNGDWDRIADLTGDASWNSGGMRRYYERVRAWLKLEQNHVPWLLQDRTLRRVGLAALSRSRVANEIVSRFLSGLGRADFTHLLELDPNDRFYVDRAMEGLFLAPKSTFGGVRNGARERLAEVQRQFPSRLTVLKNTLVSRVIFNDGTNEATGVEYLGGAHLYEADPASGGQGVPGSAKLNPGGEVILAGGAFNSPQLLMLSGIGPREQLRKYGLPVRVPLSGVGKNLQDRYEMSVVTKLRDPIALLRRCRYGSLSDPCLADYIVDKKRSIYSSNGIVLGLKKRSRRDLPEPDLYIFGLPGNFRGYYPGWSKNAFDPNYFTWAILKGHTKNTAGEVTLKSASPRATPEINFNYFKFGTDAHDDDLNAVVRGIQIARSITSAPPFRAIAETEAYPGAAFKTEEDLRAVIQRESWGHHASCTNQMGRASDSQAVVDSQFRVLGTKNLRVVDASVFPRTPGLFIVLPIYMISEKAADCILARRTG